MGKFFLFEVVSQKLFEALNIAESNIYMHPDITLIKARQSIEMILKDVFNLEGIENEYSNELKTNIETLFDYKIIDDKIHNLLNDIRIKGNMAAHEGYNEIESAKLVVDELFTMCIWYMIFYVKIDMKNINLDELSDKDRVTFYEMVYLKQCRDSFKIKVKELKERDKLYIDTFSSNGFKDLLNSKNNLNSEFEKDVFETDFEYEQRIEQMDPIKVGIAKINFNYYDDCSQILLFNAVLDKSLNIEIPKISGFYIKCKNDIGQLDKILDNYTVLARLKVNSGKSYIDIQKLYIKNREQLIYISAIVLDKMEYENDKEFKLRLSDLSGIPVGKLRLIKENYNIATGCFPIELAPYDWIKKYINENSYYIYIDKSLAKQFYNKGIIHNFYCNFNVEGLDIYIKKLYTKMDSNTYEIHCVSEIGPEFDDVQDFSEGYAAVEKLGKWGFIDKQGNVIIDLQYDDVNSFSEGYASVMRNGKWGYINKFGQLVIDLQFDEADDFTYEFKNGYSAVKKLGKWFFIDKSGIAKFDIEFDEIDDFCEGYATGYKSGKYVVIDMKGNIIIDLDLEVSYVYNFNEGYAVVEKSGRFGYIDKKGNVVIDFKFGYAENFSEGYALVLKSGKWVFIDKNGNVVIDFKFDCDCANDFSEGYAVVGKSGKYGYIDKKGNAVTDFIFDDANDFSEGYAAVKKSGKYGYVDKKGNTVTDFVFDDAYDFSEGYAAVKKSDKWGFICNPIKLFNNEEN